MAIYASDKWAAASALLITRSTRYVLPVAIYFAGAVAVPIIKKVVKTLRKK